MANKLYAAAAIGTALYARRVRLSDGQCWHVGNAAFEAYNAAHWANYVIAASEAQPGLFEVAVPAGGAAGQEMMLLYVATVGIGSEANTDSPAAPISYVWDGTGVQSLYAIYAASAAAAAAGAALVTGVNVTSFAGEAVVINTGAPVMTVLDANLARLLLQDPTTALALAGTWARYLSDRIDLVNSDQTVTNSNIDDLEAATALAFEETHEFLEDIETAIGEGGGGGGDATLAKQNQILAKLNASRLQVRGPILDDETAELVQGDAYYIADGHELSWTHPDYSGPTVGDLTVSFRLMTMEEYRAGTGAAVLTKAGSVSMAGDDAIFKVELTAAETDALSPSPADDAPNYVYQLVATGPSTRPITEAIGSLTCKRKVA